MVEKGFMICIDANEANVLWPFWAEALGYEAVETNEGAVDLVDLKGEGPLVWFQPVPETKTVKNRLHIDVLVDGSEVEGLEARLVDLGGTVIRRESRFDVLQDPEGNELCICWGEEAG